MVGGGGGLQDFIVSPSPLWVNLGFKLGWTGLGLGLEGLETNGVGVGDKAQDQILIAALTPTYLDSMDGGVECRCCKV